MALQILYGRASLLQGRGLLPVWKIELAFDLLWLSNQEMTNALMIKSLPELGMSEVGQMNLCKITCHWCH